jgi:16S rRNA (guanine527-N7)-methyltransferase
MIPSRASLQAIIERCGLTLAADQYDRLWAYHRMLRAGNAELNLTRIHNFENMVLKHYVDSLLVLRFLELPSPLIDMGSGPGLPGIPLKIARPSVSMILAEPRGARAEFLRKVVERLGLRDVEVHARKVGREFPNQVAGVITRAVGSISDTLDRVAGCLVPGGQMIFMKGPDCDDEIATASATIAGRFRMIGDHAYSIPGTPHARRLVIYERLAGAVQVELPAESSAGTASAREITSTANPHVKMCRELLTGRGIRKHGRALMAGQRLVGEVLARFPTQAEGWLTDRDGPAPPLAGLDWQRLAKPLFKELDVSGTQAPLLLVRVPEIAEWNDAAPWPAGCTLFVPFQDPENVGAVIRSAAAFQVARVVLLREAAHPFHPRSSRAAGPALFQVPLFQGPSIRELRSAAAPLFALSTGGESVDGMPFPETFGLVPGLEGPGLPAHLREGELLTIPIAPGVESLNAATATAVALYAWRSSLRLRSGRGPVPESGG